MPLNLLSPIAKIPFGKYKDLLLWQAPTSWFRWITEQDCSSETLDTLADALRMKEEEGGYAVIRRHKRQKFLIKLKSIHTQMVFAEAHCAEDENWKDYVYHILQPVKNIDSQIK